MLLFSVLSTLARRQVPTFLDHTEIVHNTNEDQLHEATQAVCGKIFREMSSPDGFPVPKGHGERGKRSQLHCKQGGVQKTWLFWLLMFPSLCPLYAVCKSKMSCTVYIGSDTAPYRRPAPSDCAQRNTDA